MTDRCSWCNADPVANAARHEGPHATWCVHYRRPARPRLRGASADFVIVDDLVELPAVDQVGKGPRA